MRYKIIDFEYNADDGISLLQASSKYGLLSVVAKAHPADEDIANQWDGYRICEYKMDIEFMKHRVRELRARYEGARDAWATVVLNNFTNNNNSLDYTLALLDIEGQVNSYKREWSKAKQKYQELKKNYYTFCETVTQLRREFRESQNK